MMHNDKQTNRTRPETNHGFSPFCYSYTVVFIIHLQLEEREEPELLSCAIVKMNQSAGPCSFVLGS